MSLKALSLSLINCPIVCFLALSVVGFLALAFAIAATGIGSAASLDMRIVPNPGDGIVGIGIGTILAFLGVGRFVSLFNRFCFPLVKSAVSYS